MQEMQDEVGHGTGGLGASNVHHFPLVPSSRTALIPSRLLLAVPLVGVISLLLTRDRFYPWALSSSSSSLPPAVSFASSPAPPLHPHLPFPVRAFWHIGDTGVDDNWRALVSQQTLRLHTSRVLDTMNVTAIYVGPDPSSIPHFEEEPGISIEYGGPANLWEFPTLQKVQDYCLQQPSSRVLYFHTKGATAPLTGPPGSKAYNVHAWRLLMEHFVLDLHLSILTHELANSSPWMVAGVVMREFRFFEYHYSGNFWLAKCEWINGLRRLNDVDTSNRYEAEWWIGNREEEWLKEKGMDCGKELVDRWCPQRDLYKCSVPEEAYRDIGTCVG